MNDFTKEELEDINFCIRDMKNQDSFDSTWDNDIRLLIIKIQSMIDTYCDHLWTEGSGNNIICTKCHKNAGKR